jgi:dTDP-4-amino-4,6-dideoxygalactose transaminase
LQAAIERVADEAAYVLGPAVSRFEQEFASYVGTRHCVGVNNGTSALHLALLAHDIGPGDEVITTPHTWISTTWAISYVGATPVFVDIDPNSYTLDPGLIERAITPRTKAVLPVHLYGRAANLEPMVKLCKQHDLVLIEDAAQAHGARDQGRPVGGIGHAGCFSFYPGKNLGAMGEAGAVVTNDDRAAERIRSLRDHAQAGRHRHVEIGFNARMEGLQGAVLSVKLKHLDAWTASRRRHAAHYHECLGKLTEIRLPGLPSTADSHVWHLFVILLPAGSREEVQRRLAERGVGSAIHYPTPVSLQPAYSHLGYKQGDFPVAEDVMGRCLSLPMFAELTDSQIEWTAESIGQCVRVN